MIQPATILGKLNPFRGKRTIVVKDQQVPDIITAMLKAHKQYAPQYDKIAMDFYTGDPVTTAKKIFKFLKDHSKYRIESDSNQRILSPSAIIVLAKYGIDCKNYALFIMGILDALKRKGLITNKIYYRFASYKMFDPTPHHVFAVMKVGNKEIYIDPVLPTFDNREKTFYNHIDKKADMALYSVSGIDTSSYEIGRIKKRKKALPATASARARAAVAKPKKQKKKIVLKVALAPARTALLTLIGVNFAGLATKLEKARMKSADKLTNLWKNFGGDPNKLIERINKGKGKKRIFGIGVVDPVTAAAAATAAPLLIKIGQFLKEIGINPDELIKAGEKLLATKVKAATDKILQADQVQADRAADQLEQMTEQPGESGSATGSKMMWPLIIAGGAAILLLTGKKSKKAK